MSADLSLTNLFEGKPIRFVTMDGCTFTPIMDIARATGVNKRTLLTILDRNPDDFASHERTLQMSTPGGNQPIRCIDHDGATNLLLTGALPQYSETTFLRVPFRSEKMSIIHYLLVGKKSDKRQAEKKGINSRLKI